MPAPPFQNRLLLFPPPPAPPPSVLLLRKPSILQVISKATFLDFKKTLLTYTSLYKCVFCFPRRNPSSFFCQLHVTFRTVFSVLPWKKDKLQKHRTRHFSRSIICFALTKPCNLHVTFRSVFSVEERFGGHPLDRQATLQHITHISLHHSFHISLQPSTSHFIHLHLTSSIHISLHPSASRPRSRHPAGKEPPDKTTTTQEQPDVSKSCLKAASWRYKALLPK